MSAPPGVRTHGRFTQSKEVIFRDVAGDLAFVDEALWVASPILLEKNEVTKPIGHSGSADLSCG